MAKDYDLFIAYHGTNDKNGSYDMAKQIAQFLIDHGYVVYTHHYAGLIKDQGLPYCDTYKVTTRSSLFLLVCNDAIATDPKTGLLTSNEINKELNFFEQSHLNNTNGFNRCTINCVYYGEKLQDKASAFFGLSHRAFLGANLLGNRNDFDAILRWVQSQITIENKAIGPSIIYLGAGDDMDELASHYIDMYANVSVGNSQLPREKLIRCIYANVSAITHKEPLEKVIDDFKKLYIYKKIYLNDGKNKNDGTRVKDLISDILDDVHEKSYFTLIGEPGSGKSTFLYYCFICCLETMKESHVIPVFVDLKGMKKEDEVRQTICENLLFPLKMISAFVEERLVELVQFLKRNYTFLIFIDSYDESYISKIGTSVRELFGFLDTDISYKVIVAMREYAFKDQKFQSNNVTYLANVYKVCDYCYQEVQIFINNLTEMKIVNEVQTEKLKKAIHLIEFDSTINPFLAAKIVEIIVNNEQRRTDKIVDLLFFTEQEISHRALSRDEKTITDERVYWVIGIRGQNNYLSSEDLSASIGLSHDTYCKAIEVIANQTYLLDNQFLFYQQLYSDFYGAKFILESFTERNRKNDRYINTILKELLNNISKKAEVFGYFALLTDYELYAKNIHFDGSVLKQFLDYIRENYHHSCLEKQHVFIMYKEMMKAIKKYSSSRIIKDKTPEEVHATYAEDRLLLDLYREYFRYLLENNCEVNYENFYFMVTSIDKYDYVLRAIYDLSSSDKKYDDQLFAMLSIVRDSYCQLYYNRKPSYPILKWLNAKRIKEKLCFIATQGKKIQEMTHRELLNYVFYSERQLSISELTFTQLEMVQMRLFPSVFNLDPWILDLEQLNKIGNVVLVSQEHGLLFDCSRYNLKNGFFSMLFVNQYEWGDESITIPEQVVSLCIYGQDEVLDKYESMGNVKTIDVSSGFTSLSDKCFYKCLYLENIILPYGLKHIGEFSLYECNYLKQLHLPETIVYLGESFIEDCFMLKELTIPENVEYIGQFAFEECTSLSEVSLKTNKLFKLEDGLFQSTISLKGIIDLSIMNNLTEIGNFAFLNCQEVEEIILPTSLKRIGIMAFEGCQKLKKVVFHDKLDCISSLSFGKEIHSLDLEFGNEKIEITSADELVSLKEKGYVEKVNIEKTVGNQRYRQLDDGTYELIFTFEDKNFTEFNTEKYDFIISSLAIGSVGNSDYLDQVILNENIRKIDEWAFEDCNSLYYVDLERTKIPSIAPHVFENCISLSKILLPSESDLIIDEYAFENCNSLRYVSTNEDGVLILNENVKEIKKYAFHKCNKLKKIVIKNKNIFIHPYAFANMKNLQIVQFPVNILDELTNHAFYGCDNLKEVIIDDEVYEIDEETRTHLTK